MAAVRYTDAWFNETICWNALVMKVKWTLAHISCALVDYNIGSSLWIPVAFDFKDVNGNKKVGLDQGSKS